MSALSDLLTRANTAGMSARAIARQARQAGFRINHDTAARYLRGDHGRPDEETLRAFAGVLPVTLTELRAAAQLPAQETEPYQPPAEASRLNRRQRRAVDEIIRAMLEPTASGVTELDGRRSAERPARTGTPSRRSHGKGQTSPRAARRGSAEPPAT